MLNVAILGTLLLVGGQQTSNGNTHGDLAVTAVVTSSVSISIDNDGKAVVVVANAPADEQTLRAATAMVQRDQRPGSQRASRKVDALHHVKNAR